MNCFIIMYNRLTSPQAMAEFLTKSGLNVILIDNNSTYPPLLEWYEKDCPYVVYRMTENLGHFVFWKSGLYERFTDRHYVVTDHDLDLSSLPPNFMDILMLGLEENTWASKAGLSLRIDDLPKNNFTKEVISWESKFWNGKKDKNGFVAADIDTTFALYDRTRDLGPLPPLGNKFFWAVRAPEPYTARHIPWYLTKEDVEANEEEKYFHSQSHGYWSQKFKELL